MLLSRFLLHMTWPRRGAQAILTTTQQPTPMRVAVILLFLSFGSGGALWTRGVWMVAYLCVASIHPLDIQAPHKSVTDDNIHVASFVPGRLSGSEFFLGQISAMIWVMYV
jgi:hypothetical protein